MYLLDTSVWIQYLRNQNSSRKKKIFEHYVIQPLKYLEVASCGIVIYELLQGAKNPSHFSDIEMIRQAALFFPMDTEDYVFGAQLSRKLMQRNQFLPMPDVMLAACAIKNDLTLVSADRHFERIRGFKSLKYKYFG